MEAVICHPGDFGDELSRFNMISDVETGCQVPHRQVRAGRARVAVGLTGIRVWTAAPEDAPECVTAAGFDHGLAVHASLESRTETDVQGGRVPDGFRRMLGHAPVHDDCGMQEFGGCAVGVHQHRDLLFTENTENAQGIAGIVHTPGGKAFDADFAGIDCLGK